MGHGTTEDTSERADFMCPEIFESPCQDLSEDDRSVLKEEAKVLAGRLRKHEQLPIAGERLILRRLQEDDSERMVDVVAKAINGEGTPEEKREQLCYYYQSFGDDILASFLDSGSAFGVYLRGDGSEGLVGTLGMRIEEDGESAEVGLVYVDSSCQKTGLTHPLREAMEIEATAYPELETLFLDATDQAKSLYQLWCFRQTQDRDDDLMLTRMERDALARSCK